MDNTALHAAIEVSVLRANVSEMRDEIRKLERSVRELELSILRLNGRLDTTVIELTSKMEVGFIEIKYDARKRSSN